MIVGVLFMEGKFEIMAYFWRWDAQSTQPTLWPMWCRQILKFHDVWRSGKEPHNNEPCKRRHLCYKYLQKRLRYPVLYIDGLVQNRGSKFCKPISSSCSKSNDSKRFMCVWKFSIYIYFLVYRINLAQNNRTALNIWQLHLCTHVLVNFESTTLLFMIYDLQIRVET